MPAAVGRLRAQTRPGSPAAPAPSRKRGRALASAPEFRRSCRRCPRHRRRRARTVPPISRRATRSRLAKNLHRRIEALLLAQLQCRGIRRGCARRRRSDRNPARHARRSSTISSGCAQARWRFPRVRRADIPLRRSHRSAPHRSASVAGSSAAIVKLFGQMILERRRRRERPFQRVLAVASSDAAGAQPSSSRSSGCCLRRRGTVALFGDRRRSRSASMSSPLEKSSRARVLCRVFRLRPQAASLPHLRRGASFAIRRARAADCARVPARHIRSSSRLDSCSSLIACCNCGVMTSDWPCRISSLCVSAMHCPRPTCRYSEKRSPR